MPALFIPGPNGPIVLGRGAGGGAYSGPGDVVSGALAWWGLRAYTLAGIGGNCIDVQRASDSSTQTFVTVSGGGVDVASLTTFLNATTGKVTKIYDQTGNGAHLANGSGSGPTLTLSGLGSLPVMTFSGAQFLQSVATFPGAPISQPYTFSAIVERTGAFTTQQFSFSVDDGGANPVAIGHTSTANTLHMIAPSAVVATASDSTCHAVQAVFNNASSDLYIDGSSNTGTSGTGSLSVGGTTIFMGEVAPAHGNQFFTGLITEVGVWGSAFNGTQKSDMNSNQHSYWGF